ncbi:alkane 1-monooxygenase [Flexithrix dorotheae]|uniref:alkane 1-monooxygenase n=1 Tax=Flexithrix dorotheae TaxID=70993 RepID=UPI000373F708|nr:alkane 1-monooxygenase [Flexithrix dorotheae]
MKSKISALKYLSILTVPLTVFISFTSRGWLTFIPFLYIFALIPLIELLFKPVAKNLEKAEEAILKEDPVYDWMLYIIVPIQYLFLIFFLFQISEPGLKRWEMVGRITAMGFLCGNFGINVAHELGHRKSKFEQFLAKALLLTSLYMQFFIEHNRGHHKKVSTPEDPASAQYGQTLYQFWFSSAIFGYLSAWKLENERLTRKGLKAYSLGNEMLQYHLIKITFLVIIYLIFGLTPLLAFVGAAFMGGFLLETINYIEHYGLTRNKINEDHYERVLPIHSWNSNHIIGRLLLFELSRHSDHHFNASRKYQILRHHVKSPQMPTGYPGMMLLSTIPPIWFFVMHKKLKQLKA